MNREALGLGEQVAHTCARFTRSRRWMHTLSIEALAVTLAAFPDTILGRLFLLLAVAGAIIRWSNSG